MNVCAHVWYSTREERERGSGGEHNNNREEEEREREKSADFETLYICTEFKVCCKVCHTMSRCEIHFSMQVTQQF